MGLRVSEELDSIGDDTAGEHGGSERTSEDGNSVGEGGDLGGGDGGRGGVGVEGMR